MAEPAASRELLVKFPRGHFDVKVQDIDSIPGLRARFPSLTEPATFITVHLHYSHNVVVDGYAKPFSNPGHPCDGWFNRNLPIDDGITLLGLLEERRFHFVLSKNTDYYNRFWTESMLPPPFSYPYKHRLSWDIEEYRKEFSEHRGEPFARAITFPNDESRMAAVTQSAIQDVIWIADAAAEIFATKLSAYFIPSQTDQNGMCSRYYVIIPLSTEFYDKYEQQWLALTDCESFKLAFHDHDSAMAPPSLAEEEDWKKMALSTWDAKIEQCPQHVAVMAHHPVEENDLVLFVSRGALGLKVPTFQDRFAANTALRGDKRSWACVSFLFDTGLKECERKVNAAFQYHEGADPSNIIPSPSNDTSLMMAFHRALQRGTGFYDILRASRSSNPANSLVESMEHSVISDSGSTRQQLPNVSFLGSGDPAYIDALLEDVLPKDRARFRGYFGNRPLGLSLVTAGPGFGKTTVIAVATLSMVASIGPVYASAPTNVAVDNFASRLSAVDRKAVERCTKGKSEDPERIRRRLIVRGYTVLEEVQAFRKLLQSPADADEAAPKRHWKPQSRWKLHLSASYWLLMILRSPAVRALEPEDAKILWSAQELYDAQPDLQKLRELATGRIEWKEFEGNMAGEPKQIQKMLETIIAVADIVCTTPAQSERVPAYKKWKKNTARAIAVDEAANMTIPDLDCVWGNTMLPCLLVGDEKQLEPTLMTRLQKDPKTGNLYNRHVSDGSVSPLAFFKSTGWPVYRMLTQFRMARGLFDICHRELYSDVPFEYDAGCNIDLPQHAIGVTLENFARQRFPELSPPPAGQLAPIFVHCEGTVCFKDRYSMSLINYGQVDIALDFLVSFVNETKTDPSQIGLICPYKATSVLIERLRKKKAEYLPLALMEPAATVDSYQGREKSIIVVVMSTTEARGSGFTANRNRLNVLLSRHKSGLVIFGDINVVEPLISAKSEGEEGKSKGKGKGKKVKGKAVVTRGYGNKGVWFKAGMLKSVHANLVKEGRVATVVWKKRIV
ncbi:unnamed protein product [Clonostachys rhizophaga]|uniref:DNA2/NAM7 helicase-like C-terminal domain-containing protein n=1 Tax=Clonostachys rhizophaga TaxID=160324 RepID=A0A9N9VPV2_9HYPO|nr:unnamed protein product [Clonostachys rhizophaga]